MLGGGHQLEYIQHGTIQSQINRVLNPNAARYSVIDLTTMSFHLE
jgi:hypothetical protein